MAPGAAAGGDMLPRAGFVTVKMLLVETLGTELTTTTTGPVVTLLGGMAVIPALLQDVIDAAGTPLNVTVLLPCDEPKLFPEIPTGVPVTPELGSKPEITGVGTTVKLGPEP